jgi:hypothetical protein
MGLGLGRRQRVHCSFQDRLEAPQAQRQVTSSPDVVEPAAGVVWCHVRDNSGVGQWGKAQRGVLCVSIHLCDLRC